MILMIKKSKSIMRNCNSNRYSLRLNNNKCMMITIRMKKCSINSNSSNNSFKINNSNISNNMIKI